MTEIRAFVFATRQHLLTLDSAKMQACRVTSPSTQLFLYWTANFFTLVLVAGLELFAHNLAFEVLNLLYL